MTSGEVKGFLKQLRMRATSDEEREAVDFALEAIRLMMIIAPTISKANKLNDEIRETKHESNDSGSGGTVDVINDSCPSKGEPNTGWIGDDFPPDRKRLK